MPKKVKVLLHKNSLFVFTLKDTWYWTSKSLLHFHKNMWKKLKLLANLSITNSWPINAVANKNTLLWVAKNVYMFAHICNICVKKFFLFPETFCVCNKCSPVCTASKQNLCFVSCRSNNMSLFAGTLTTWVRTWTWSIECKSVWDNTCKHTQVPAQTKLQVARKYQELRYSCIHLVRGQRSKVI